MIPSKPDERVETSEKARQQCYGRGLAEHEDRGTRSSSPKPWLIQGSVKHIMQGGDLVRVVPMEPQAKDSGADGSPDSFAGSLKRPGSNPDAFTPQPVHDCRTRETDPLAQIAQTHAHSLKIRQSPVQKRFRLGEIGRRILGHEEFGTGVDSSKRCAFGVPTCVDAGVGGKEPDFVAEAGEFGEGRTDVLGKSHCGECLFCEERKGI